MVKMKVDMPGVAQGKKLSGTRMDYDASPEERVQSLFEGSLKNGEYHGWAAPLFQEDFSLVSASSTPAGKTVFRYTVKPEHCNRLGNLHGGCTATIFDLATTTCLAPIARPGFWAYSGVSRTLNVTYIRPVAEGETVLVESEVVHAGKRLCSLKGVMKRESDGAVMATCEHGKVSIDPEVPKL